MHWTNLKIKVKAFAAGGVDYVTKPFKGEEVLARVKTHLTLRKMQKQLEDKNKQLELEISERKRTEKQLRYRANFERINDTITLISSEFVLS